jgi:NAD(P)-dependent dehydrogenase (short-subunit alcohol dehydrogenase family)
MSESKSPNLKGVCLVVGAGDSLGGAVARRFSREGYNVALSRRSENSLSSFVSSIESSAIVKGYPCDARKEAAVEKLFVDVEKDLGELSCVVFNIGAWYNESMLTITAQKFR